MLENAACSSNATEARAVDKWRGQLLANLPPDFKFVGRAFSFSVTTPELVVEHLMKNYSYHRTCGRIEPSAYIGDVRAEIERADSKQTAARIPHAVTPRREWPQGGGLCTGRAVLCSLWGGGVHLGVRWLPVPACEEQEEG